MSRGRISDIKNPRVRIAVVAALIVFAGWLFYMEFSSRDLLSEEGVYTIADVQRVIKPAGRKGAVLTKAEFIYRYNGKVYVGSNSNRDFIKSMEGKRFFVLVAPGNTKKTILLPDRPVPRWYTVPPPAQGWEKIPSEYDLMEMEKRYRDSEPVTESPSQ